MRSGTKERLYFDIQFFPFVFIFTELIGIGLYDSCPPNQLIKSLGEVIEPDAIAFSSPGLYRNTELNSTFPSLVINLATNETESPINFNFKSIFPSSGSK